jgi:hypothetical protein
VADHRSRRHPPLSIPGRRTQRISYRQRSCRYRNSGTSFLAYGIYSTSFSCRGRAHSLSSLSRHRRSAHAPKLASAETAIHDAIRQTAVNSNTSTRATPARFYNAAAVSRILTGNAF